MGFFEPPPPVAAVAPAVPAVPAVPRAAVEAVRIPLHGDARTARVAVCQRPARWSVVVAGLDDDEFVGLDRVDQAVFVVDASGPEAGEVAGEAFGLAGAGTGVAGGFGDEAVDTGQDFALTGPAGVVGPAVRGEDDLHSASSWRSVSPARS